MHTMLLWVKHIRFSGGSKTALLFLALTTGIVGYSILAAAGPVAQSHGSLRVQALIVTSLAGLLGALYGIVLRPDFKLGTKVTWLVFLMPAYVLFQTVPLPLWAVRIMSPARAGLADALVPIMPRPGWVTLSVAPSATLYHFLLFAVCTVVFLVIFDLSWRLSSTPWLVMIPLIFVAAGEAIIGLLQVTLNPDAVATGTYPIRNHYAGFLEMILPFAALYPFTILASRGPGRRNEVASALFACIGFGVSALLVAGILSSLSRMGFIAAITSIVFIAIAAVSDRRSLGRIAVTLAGAVFAAMLVFFLMPSARLVMRFGEIEKTKEARSPARETLNLIRAYPLFGCGLGAYESAFLKFKLSEPALNQDYAHNDYLQYLAELGSVGFVIGVVTLAMILAKLPGCFRQSRPELRWLSLACAGSTMAIAIHSFVDFNLYVPANLLTFAWILGVSANVGLLGSRNPSAAVGSGAVIFVPETLAQSKPYL
jgi:O-antigen ligase